MTAADPWRNIDQFLAACRIRFGPPTLGQTTGGAHKPNSLHYEGRARDYGAIHSDVYAILHVLRPFAVGSDSVIEELFGYETYMDNGRRIVPSKGLWASHQNHVHVGLRRGKVLPIPTIYREGKPMADNPDLPNIEGPLSFHPIVTSAGEVKGYYIFSTSTGELHAYEVPYKGRSEDLTPD